MDQDSLFQEILTARQRVYAAGDPTPLQKLDIAEFHCDVWVKREDLGPIKAYKWRGAYNAVASLSAEQRAKGIVAASAGNHGQGVALAAHKLDCKAIVFMPVSTPEVKQREVKRHGGANVEIRLVGDSYDDAGIAAKQYCKEAGAEYVHPYDALTTMGGQGTLADEVVMSGKGPFDRVYVPIGGGGLAAAVGCWFKKFWPECKVIGVEGEDQASMKAAIAEGAPTELNYVDVFCDGTAVRKVGSNTFDICNEVLDEIVTVSNDEVCHGIRRLWETIRAIPEPSGAMALAAVAQDHAAGRINEGDKVLTVISGANMDFAQLANISRRAGIGSRQRRYLRVPIPEGKGSLLAFLKALPEEVSIVDLQYGRLESSAQYPVVGMIGSAEDYAKIDDLLAQRGVKASDVSTDEVVGYRIINYDPDTFRSPLFVNVEFPERAGAFQQFMDKVSDLTSLCYFNYEYSGERVGRALVGMDFADESAKESCQALLKEMIGGDVRDVRAVSEETLKRLLG